MHTGSSNVKNLIKKPITHNLQFKKRTPKEKLLTKM